MNAATGFGKTVIASYMIAKRKVNTLIILQNSQLIQQWIEELERFLEIKEKLPEYETKTGRKKKRDSLIGVLQGNRDTLSGIVDIAMVGSLYRKGNYHKEIKNLHISKGENFIFPLKNYFNISQFTHIIPHRGGTIRV